MLAHVSSGESYSYVCDERGDATLTRCTSTEHTIRVPDAIEGHPVVCFSDSAFAGLHQVREIECPPSVSRIGARAFADCRNLERLRLPDALDGFDPSWVSGCARLDDIALPDGLAVVPSGLFDLCRPRRLALGRKAQSVEAPRFGTLDLCDLRIHPDNPHLFSDGYALYNKDRFELCLLFRPCKAYRVQEGCRSIAPYAFAHHVELESLILPDSVEAVGAAAFAGTERLSSLVLPVSCCRSAEAAIETVSDVPQDVMAAYDAAIWELEPFKPRCDQMIARLLDPLFLDDGTRRAFRRRVSAELVVYAREIAEANELRRFEDLADADLLDAASIAEILDALPLRRHAEAAAYLLALRHRRFPGALADYSV